MHNAHSVRRNARGTREIVTKQASIIVGRCSHAHQFKRARRMLKFLRTRLGRLISDIGRLGDSETTEYGNLHPVQDECEGSRVRKPDASGPDSLGMR